MTSTAFDALDQVMLAVTIREYETPDGPSTVVAQETFMVPGHGEDDPRRWARDALVAIAERM